MSDEQRTQTEAEASEHTGEPGDATRYPGHEHPDALRERSGLAGNSGREPEIAPDVDAGDDPDATS